MSAAFTQQLRARRAPVEISAGPGATAFRVQAAELWDAVRVVALPVTPVSEVKQRALAALLPDADFTDDYVLKLRGWEMLDQRASLRDSGVEDGSILLLAHRRRRPVR